MSKAGILVLHVFLCHTTDFQLALQSLDRIFKIKNYGLIRIPQVGIDIYAMAGVLLGPHKYFPNTTGSLKGTS